MPEQLELEFVFKKESIVKDVGKIFSRTTHVSWQFSSATSLMVGDEMVYHPIYEIDGKIKIDWEKEV